jgi:enoyl-CoA hydratase/carnithine racemase
MVTGRLFDYDEARELGLVNEVMEAPDEAAFLAQAVAYARGFCAPGRAALAAGLIKRSVQTGSEVPLETGLALEREFQARLFASEDAREGIAAFVEKRPPRFAVPSDQKCGARILRIGLRTRERNSARWAHRQFWQARL